MVSFPFLQGFAVTECRDNVPLRASAVWEATTNFDTVLPTCTTLKSIKRIDGSEPGDPVKVGSRFCLHIQLQDGSDFQSDCVVTAFEVAANKDEDTGATITTRKLTTFYDEMAGVGSATRTIVVESSTDAPEECRVTLTMALIPDKVCTVVSTVMCFCRYEKNVRVSVESELDELLEHVAAKEEESGG